MRHNRSGGVFVIILFAQVEEEPGKNRGSSTNPRLGYLVAYCSARGRHL